MPDYTHSSEEEQLWVDLLEVGAKPARRPQFPELNSAGEWTNWTAAPVLPDIDPSSVEQPFSTQNFSGEDTQNRSYDRFRSTPLPDGYIRLLKIQDARMDTKSNVLHDFELHEFPLRTAPSYDCISYCWGDKRLCTGIVFNHSDGYKRVFRVTEDLATCLYSIKNSKTLDAPAYIWADQICVNQGDIMERNSQVKIMVNIYRQANRVIVWLGQEANDILWKQGCAKIHLRLPHLANLEMEEKLQLVTKASILTRDWFNRLWVRTEITKPIRYYTDFPSSETTDLPRSHRCKKHRGSHR
jgi:hypothetical protein